MHQNVFAVRGAITVEQNNVDSILNNTSELLKQLIANNDLNENNIISAFFTVTSDLDACFPAKAARDLGWTNTALMCAQEIEVQNSLSKCVRVMIHYYSNADHKPVPVYLNDAATLRPDLEKNN